MDRESIVTYPAPREFPGVAETLHSYNTDKARLHTYGPVYERILTEDFRKNTYCVLELGILAGESLLAWRDIFPRAIIVGIDIDRNSMITDKDRIQTYCGPQNDAELLRRVGHEYGPFNIIIDDCSHKIEDQLVSLLNLWHYLQPGGLYVIEDIFPQYFHAYQSFPCEITEGNQFTIGDNIAVFHKEA